MKLVPSDISGISPERGAYLLLRLPRRQRTILSMKIQSKDRMENESHSVANIQMKARVSRITMTMRISNKSQARESHKVQAPERQGNKVE